MPIQTQYFIAKYVADPMRMEPRNVGVICVRGSENAARFLGEIAPGTIDGRTLRGFEFPDVYRQWVAYWRHALKTEISVSKLAAAAGSHYQVTMGGEVSEDGDDPLSGVVDYLYSFLVSDGGFREAIKNPQETEPEALVLRDDLATVFAQHNLLALSDDAPALIKYPIRRNVELAGERVINHRPSFVQQNGVFSVIETVDFTSKSKERSKDHAGLVGYMFEDLRKKYRDNCATISVIKASPEDKEAKQVQYAMSILSSESNRLVDWFDPSDRKAFLGECLQIGLGS